MSKVSLKNESLPTFEPLEQTKVPTQKRKRTLKNNSLNENEASNKRAKAKKNTFSSLEHIKPVVWIGATLMQTEEAKSEERPAAFSIFYGLNDKRNTTEKVVLEQNQDLSHVYVMGAIRVLETFQDEEGLLSIHTGNNDIQTAINQESQDVIFEDIKEMIAKRKGATIIRFKDDTASGKSEESNIAHKMAEDMLFGDEAMVLDNAEAGVVEALEVVMNEVSKKVEDFKSTGDVEMIVETDEITPTNTTIVTETEKEPAPVPSWVAALNIRNLLDILKAPFVRNKKN